MGLVKGSYTIHLGEVFALEAKLLTVMFAIAKVKVFNWHPVWIECDYSLVVSMLYWSSLDLPWHLKARWSSFISFVSTIQYKVTHI